MEMFNEWLREIQSTGRGTELYNLTGTVCVALLVLSALFYTWRMRLNPFKSIVIGCVVYFFLSYAQHLVTWYRRDFALGEGFWGTANVGYGLILLPILCWLCDKAFNLKDGTSGELAVFTTFAWHFVGRSGCVFSGCCYGIDCEWGVYSVYAGGNTFPVCWLESLLCLGILIFLLVRILRRGVMPEESKSKYRLMQKYYRKRRIPDNGRSLPYALLFYGIGRFFTEFLRYHPEEDMVFGGVSEFSVIALVMALVGGGLLYWNVYSTSKKAAAEETLPTLGGQRH